MEWTIEVIGIVALGVIGVIGLILLLAFGIKLERMLVQLSEIRDLLAAIYDKTRL